MSMAYMQLYAHIYIPYDRIYDTAHSSQHATGSGRGQRAHAAARGTPRSRVTAHPHGS